MNTKNSIFFFLKVLFIIFTFAFIGLLVKGLIGQRPINKIKGIPFLSVADKDVDSIISKLTVEQKINFIFRETRFDNNDYNDSISENLNGLIDSTNQTGNGNKTKTTILEIKDILDRNDVFKSILNQDYLQAITDTVFLYNYLKSRIIKFDINTNNFLYHSLVNYNLKNISDTEFVYFQKDRIHKAIKLYRNENVLFGVQTNLQNLLILDSISKKNNLKVDSLNSLVKNDLDFILIDSLAEPEKFQLKFTGLCLVNFTPVKFPDNEGIFELLDKDIDIYFIQSIEYQKYKTALLDLINSGKYDIEKLNVKLRKIIKSKIWSYNRQSNEYKGYVQSEAVWNQQMVEKSICLLNNPDSIVPIKRIDNKTFTVLWVGQSINKTFIQYCNEYVPVSGILLTPGQKNWQKKVGKLTKKNFLILVLDTSILKQADNEQFVDLMEQINKSSLIVVNIRNYQNLQFISDSISCIQTQSNSDIDYKFAAQLLFGGISMQGQLPLNINKHYSFGLKNISPKTRVKYGLAGDVGIDDKKLKQIDQIVLEGINSGAFPGCQVFVIKNGEVIYDKCFGYHSWTKETVVKPDDVYDLASVTKIAATTIASMKMISDRKMSLNDQLGKFFKNTTIDYTRIKADTVVKIDTFIRADIENWKSFLAQNDTSNINDSCFVTIDTVITKLTPKLNIFKVPLVDLLMHKSGIIPATPIFRYIFYREYYIKQMKQKILAFHGKSGTLFNLGSFELPPSFPDNSNLNDSLKQLIKLGFKKQYQEYFSKQFVKDSSDKVRLTENLYLKNKYFDTIWRDTKQMPVYSKKIFQYSDVNMILLQLAIDSLNRSNIDEYMKKTIYNSLGLKTITYLPLKYYPKSRIVPTEMDESWRYGYLHGYVHDPSAALMGGVAGNAGLYSNARDLGILFQMVLNQGSYGGIQYINPSVIQTFTRRNDYTQRSLGFDMPNMKAAVGTKAPHSTYGHTGYTGTCVWVDPENKLIYVFLSNRNNTSSKNWRLNTYKIRERIHDAIYDAFISEN